MGKFHVQQQKCATVCLEVFRQWIHDQIVSGCALKPDFACLNFNTAYLLKLRGTYQKSSDTSVSQGAMLKVGGRPAATAGLGEQDHLLVITDTATSAKGSVRRSNTII